MKKMYIKPENTIVALNVNISLMEGTNLNSGEGNNGESAGAREVVFSQETVNSRNAWEVWE